MKLSFDIIDSSSEIQKNILKAMLPHCNDFMDKAITTIKDNLPSLIFESISNTPEYSSLVSGKLKFELGIPDASMKVAQLLNLWSFNVQYNYKKPSIINNNIRSSFSANAIKADFSDVLNTDYAIVRDDRGYSLPWLQWLLLDGNVVIIPQYSVMLGSNSRSRTGFAVMVDSKTNWRVPSEFSGTQNDNWITRAIDSAKNDIQNLLNKAFIQ